MNARVSGYPCDIPINYISISEDVAMLAALAEQMIVNLGVDVQHRVLTAGHDVVASRPRELAAMINGLAVGNPRRI